MSRRQALAVLSLALLWKSGLAVPDPRMDDLRLEEQISLAQGLCVKAGNTYQDWFNGRINSPPAARAVAENLAGLQTFQDQAVRLAVPGARAAVRHWARMQKQELKFFLADIKPNKQRPTQAELQQRWQNAVDIQTDLVTARGQQLEVVSKGAGRPELLAYYRWKRELLDIQKSELGLARQVAQGFQLRRPLNGITSQALSLARRAEAVKAPAVCQKAQSLYVERFNVLSRLCDAADEAIQSTNQETVEELQDNEAVYRQKTLASDDASLVALRALLSKSR
ncbi:MAG: hypothetical protein U0931_12990 [Vulcanimicrobiota bacterium]